MTQEDATDLLFDANAPLTTYEQASLSLQQAGVALTVGLIQAGVVGWGIRYMTRMGERREQQHADRHTETMRVLDQQATASREQHTATMRALEALIERTAPPHT